MKYIPRSDVPEYLIEKFGAPAAVSKATLAKMATVGGGPRFSKFGRKVAYRPEDLDDWALSRLSPARSNTSEA